MEKVYDTKMTLDLLYTTGPKAIRSDVHDTVCIGEYWGGAGCGISTLLLESLIVPSEDEQIRKEFTVFPSFGKQ